MTRPGTFSSDAPDPGSVFLVETLPRSMKGTIADLGAGWGYLARHLLDHSAVTELHLVEAQKSALDCARHNVADPRVRFHWADAGAISDLPPLDVVVTNPPFHKGRKGDPSLGVAFIEASRRLLKPAGELWLVANRHLPYEKALDQAFLDVTAIAQTPGYKIFHARRPKRRRS
jgi:16S rRNA (guanine1207-N2)-methyltransferase